jgi:hypothetical protein
MKSRAALVAFLCLVSLVGIPQVAHAQSPQPVLKVVLLGDSYMSGNGARSPSNAWDYYGPEDCLRSHSNWGEQWANSLAVPTAVRPCVTLRWR